MAKRVINAMNAGELSPYLYTRQDLEKYNSGCITMENFVPLPYGGVTRRPAIEYMGESKKDDLVHMLPFISSVDNAYQLEFGDQYIRVWDSDGRVNETETELVSATYKWSASGSGTNEYYCELSGGGDPSLSVPDYLTEGGLDMRFGTLGNLRVSGWGFGDNDTLGYDTIYVRLSDESDPDTQDSGFIVAQEVVEMETPFDDADLRGIKYVQSIDRMWLVHPDYGEYEIERTSDTEWEFGAVEYIYPPMLNENKSSITMEPSGTTGTITLTSSSDFFDEDHVGAYMAFRTVRCLANQSISNSFTTTDFSTEAGINVSGSNWSVTTEGTWRGRLAIQRSLDNGTTW